MRIDWLKVKGGWQVFRDGEKAEVLNTKELKKLLKQEGKLQTRPSLPRV